MEKTTTIYKLHCFFMTADMVVEVGIDKYIESYGKILSFNLLTENKSSCFAVVRGKKIQLHFLPLGLKPNLSLMIFMIPELFNYVMNLPF